MGSDSARMVRRLREQAGECARFGSPMYHALLTRVADDVQAGGPAASVLRGHEQDPGRAALGLRLLGGVHRLVLQGRARALAAHYPSVGGDGDAGAAWPPLRAVLEQHRDELAALLDQPPQTNEVGRAAALVGGLLHLVAVANRPVRLVEIGTSAGLNLRADQFRVESVDGTGWGPTGSPVVLAAAWAGPPPPTGVDLNVVSRTGCDTAPIDPTTDEGRLSLTSYVWPDQLVRLARLRGALQIAAGVPATVRRESAADFLRSVTLVPGTTTVLWHSVMWQYLAESERAEVTERVEELGAEADGGTGFAHLVLEPGWHQPRGNRDFVVVLRSWPGGEDRVLGLAHPHGVPTTWSGGPA